MKYLKVWTDFADVLETLEDAEVGRLFIAMLRYADTGEIPQRFEGNERFVWPVARRDIDMMAERTEVLRQNGAKGGFAKSRNRQALANDSKSYQSVANDSEAKQNEANCSLKEKKGKEKEKKIKETENIVPLTRFIPPTVEEVALYCVERRNHVDAGKFVDYYSSNGWRVGKNPMKDWKAAVRTWERSEITEKDYQYDRDHSGLPY